MVFVLWLKRKQKQKQKQKQKSIESDREFISDRLVS